MKIKKCPYCGKRITYTTSYNSRRKGEYVCERCGKESKVIINKKIYFVFILFLLISAAIAAGWIFVGLSSNILGVAAVAAPLIIFAATTPGFVYYEPLKKYKKSMEAKKAGIEYSDNLITSGLDESEKVFSTQKLSDNSGKFKINNDVFNKIRAERNAARQGLQSDEIISDSKKVGFEENNESFVPVINDVREEHISTDAPLRKIHSESKNDFSRRSHYTPSESKSDLEKARKYDGNRYSSNRKF